MSGFVLRGFKGIVPRAAPRLLGDHQAQVAENCVVASGTLRPLRSNLAVMTLPKAGPIRTIHRFGQSVAADDQYWFSWDKDVDVVRGPVFGDTQERTYWTGDGLPKVTDNSIALSGGTAYPMNAYTLGIPGPATPPVAVVGGVGAPKALAETRIYVETFVSGWGEEGEPSAASNAVDVIVGQTVTLALAAVPTGAHNLTARRIYRSVTGGSGSPFLLVAEVPIASASYVDSALASALGEQLPSLSYAMPPAGLSGLVALPGGVMAGFVGRDLYFCEPYKPYAWPVAYSMTVESEIVALGVFDTTLLVLTKGAPVIVSGSDPSNYTPVKASIPQACVSKRSVVDVGGGVAYASPDGLFLIGGGTAKNLTEAHFTRREWQAMKPAELCGHFVDGRYIGFFSTGGFILDLITGDLVTLDWTASAGHYDPIRDALFLVVGGNRLVKFDAGATNSTLRWRSKAFYRPSPCNYGAAFVDADSYPVQITVDADRDEMGKATKIEVIKFTACNGVLTLHKGADNKVMAARYTQPVTSAEVFRLPSGFLGKQLEFEVSGTAEIHGAGVATVVQDFQNG